MVHDLLALGGVNDVLALVTYSLVSLYEMLIFSAFDFYYLASYLVANIEQLRGLGDAVLTEEQKKSLRSDISMFEDSCNKIGLPVTKLYAATMKETLLKADLTASTMKRMTETFHERFADETRLHLFMQIQSDHIKLYNDPRTEFGTEIIQKFPSAEDDIERAGKCLACGLGTACVFHLMRVMEASLKATARALGIPYAPSWES